MSEKPDVTANPYSVSPASLDAAADADRARVTTFGLATRWPRFFARGTDLFIASTLVGGLLGALFPDQAIALASAPVGGILAGICLLPIALVLDAVIYGVFGNTLGKAIAGVKVLTLDGRKVGFWAYLRRNYHVWFAGMGLSLPLISLIFLIRSFGTDESGKLQPWDVMSDTRSYGIAQSTVRTWIVGSLFAAGTLYAHFERLLTLNALR